MPEMRLYVGGLGNKVDRAALGSRLSHYVSVLDIDLKEKTDADGNVVFRFAYASVDAPPSKIEECMRQLNGASWQGSYLRIEPAKENFLDRLKRERATIQQQEKQQSSHIENMDTSASAVTFPKTAREKDGEIVSKRPLEDSTAENSAVLNDNQSNTKKHKRNNHSESTQVETTVSGNAVHTSEKQKRKSIEKKNLTAESELPVLIQSSSKKKNKAEEEMLSSFKSFSSVWADSDSENNEGNETIDGKKNNKSTNVVKSHMASQKVKSKESTSVPDYINNDESDASDDENGENGHIVGDVEKEHLAQLEILANLEGTNDTSSKSKLRSDEGSVSTVQHMVRYDPTQADHNQSKLHSLQKQETGENGVCEPSAENKYVKVAKDLNFGQKSSGFSLLAQFSQQRKEEGEESGTEEVTVPVSVLPKPDAVVSQQQVKTKKFFVQPSDPMLEAAITWMAQSLTEEVSKEFREAQPHLRELYKTRAIRALRKERDSRGRGRGRGQGRGRGRGTRGKKPNQDRRW